MDLLRRDVMGFKAGFGTADITPDYPVTMSGFAIRTGHSQGVHDRLQARALAIEASGRMTCLLILDLIGVSAKLTRKLRDALTNIYPQSELVCLATHSHGAAAVLENAYLGQPAQAYLAFVEQQSLEALQKALSSRQACTLHYGVSQETTVAHNRRDPHGVIDTDVAALRFQAAHSQEIEHCLGLLVSYACHPVVLGPQNQLLTRDYPGYVIDNLENRYPQATVLFATGCAGQINTGHLATDSWRHGVSHTRTFEEAHRIGQLLATAAQQASEDAMQTPPLARHLGVARADVALTLDSSYAPSPEVLNVWQQHAASDDPAARILADIRLQWAKTRKRVAQHMTHLCVLRLGELVMPIFPGEPFVDYALYLKKQCVTPVLALAYGNDNPGYLPTAQAYTEGGYEVEDAFMFYGLPAPFTPSLELTLKDAMTTLMKEVGCACL
ncbi:MAG: neutral/alkaline non-lysosomal ceramidase N-terminal domain-containing protein [Deinococcota bacterium]